MSPVSSSTSPDRSGRVSHHELRAGFRSARSAEREEVVDPGGVHEGDFAQVELNQLPGGELGQIGIVVEDVVGGCVAVAAPPDRQPVAGAFGDGSELVGLCHRGGPP